MSATSRFDSEAAAYQDRLASIKEQTNSAKELAMLTPSDAFTKVLEATSEPLGAHLMATGIGNFLGKDAVGELAKGNIKSGLQKAVQDKIGGQVEGALSDVKDRISRISAPIQESLQNVEAPTLRVPSSSMPSMPSISESLEGLEPTISNPFSTGLPNMENMPASESLLTKLEARGQLATGAGRSDPSLPDLPGLSETTPGSIEMDQLAPLREMMANRSVQAPTSVESAPKPGTTSRINTGEIENPVFEGIEGGESGASIETEDAAAKSAVTAAKSAVTGAADDAAGAAAKIGSKIGAGLEGLGDDAALALAPETGGLSELAAPLIGALTSLFGGFAGAFEHHATAAVAAAPKLSQPLFIPGLQQT